MVECVAEPCGTQRESGVESQMLNTAQPHSFFLSGQESVKRHAQLTRKQSQAVRSGRRPRR